MKPKNSLFLWILLLAITTHAQVGIGTSSPFASLDIRPSSQASPIATDGILIPKVQIFPASPTVDQHGMLVFLLNTVGANQPGFYYWNQPTTTWIGLGAATPGWALTGNAATTPYGPTTYNFMGTTDNQDIVFKRNNIKSGFIGDPVFAGAIWTNGNTSWGANSLINVVANSALQRGVRNTAIGANTMKDLVNGKRNVAVGESAMYANTDGSENTAVGVGALYSNETLGGNVAIGRQALTTVKGAFNTGIGFSALRQSATGQYNTALGAQAGYNNTGSYNVFLGNEAGFNETGSNKLYIESLTANVSNPLVYGEFDNKRLRINGELQVYDPATVGYRFPTGRGLPNQVLTTDGAGTASWVSPGTSSLSVVRATKNFPFPNSTVDDQNLNNSGWQKITFSSIMEDTNSEFSTANSRFTALKTGYYLVNAGYHIRPMTGTDYYTIGIRVNSGSTNIYYAENGYNHTGGATATIVARMITSTIKLNAGDYIEIYAQCTANGAIIESYTGKTFFEVHQIR